MTERKFKSFTAINRTTMQLDGPQYDDRTHIPARNAGQALREYARVVDCRNHGFAMIEVFSYDGGEVEKAFDVITEPDRKVTFGL